jgi:hypothetical protein
MAACCSEALVIAARCGDARGARGLAWACNGPDGRGAVLEAAAAAEAAGHTPLAAELRAFHGDAESHERAAEPGTLSLGCVIDLATTAAGTGGLLGHLLAAPSFSGERGDGRQLSRAAGDAAQRPRRDEHPARGAA